MKQPSTPARVLYLLAVVVFMVLLAMIFGGGRLGRNDITSIAWTAALAAVMVLPLGHLRWWREARNAVRDPVTVLLVIAAGDPLSSHADSLWYWLGLILLAVAVRTAALLLEDHPISLLWRDPVTAEPLD